MTRDLVPTSGEYETADDPRTELLLAIGIERDRFHGDPDQGSTISGLISGRPPADARAAAIAAARDALRRLETRGRVTIRFIDVDDGDLVIATDELSDSLRVEIS